MRGSPSHRAPGDRKPSSALNLLLSSSSLPLQMTHHSASSWPETQELSSIHSSPSFLSLFPRYLKENVLILQLPPVLVWLFKKLIPSISMKKDVCKRKCERSPGRLGEPSDQDAVWPWVREKGRKPWWKCPTLFCSVRKLPQSHYWAFRVSQNTPMYLLLLPQ